MNDSTKITNPFPGLRPFDTDENRLFFGREGQSDALIDRLQRSRFLAVVGTSGSGKSSLIRAGLLPALRGGLMAGAGSGWRIAVMRPGSDPAGNLAQAIGQPDVLQEAGGGLPPTEAEAVIEATLRRGSLGLVDVARLGQLGEHEKLLIVVDQFEELFRFRAARPHASIDDQAFAFVKLLLEASKQRQFSIFVVITMRSDFLGDCSQFEGLPEAINDGQYLIPRMTRDERRLAIAGPVAITRTKITEPLVSRLLNDVGDNPDQLPILQHALMRTWDYWQIHRRNGEPLGLDHYQAIGGMSKALSLHADEAWAELPDERSRQIAEILFKALAERGADNREIRRPTPLRLICEIAGATAAEVVSVVDVFRQEGRSFLMPPVGIALLPESVIDISHESLIRNWVRLKDWVSEEADSARTYRRLAAATAFSDESYLPAGLLEAALVWREKNNPNAAWADRYSSESEITFEKVLAFIETSRSAHAAAAAERERRRNEELERERRERERADLSAAKERRAAQRLRRYIFALIGISLLAVVLASVAIAALVETRKSKSRVQDLALSLQDRVTDVERLARLSDQALNSANSAKDEANTQRDKAVAAEKSASIERTRAQKLAVDLRQALSAATNAKAEVARQLAVAVAAQKDAQNEVEKNRKTKIANGKFSEGVTAAQKGDTLRAEFLFNEAINEYRELNNQEAVGDTKSQMGNMLFASIYSDYVRRNGVTFGNSRRLYNLKELYKEASDIYRKENLPEKAGAVSYAAAEMLMKLTKESVQKGATGQPIVDSAATETVPEFGMNERFDFPEDPVIHPQRTADDPALAFVSAIMMYKAAFVEYREVWNREKLKSREAINFAVVEGMDNSSFRLGNFYLKGANAGRCIDALQIKPGSQPNDTFFESEPQEPVAAPQSANYCRRQAAQYFTELLHQDDGPYKPDDIHVGNVLTWIGGLYYEMDDKKQAALYYKRVPPAVQDWQKEDTDKDDHAVIKYKMGKTLSEVGLLRAAEAQLQEALQLRVGTSTNDPKPAEHLKNKGDILDALGQVYERLSVQNSYMQANDFYRQAVVAYQKAHDADPKSTLEFEPDLLITIGAFAKGAQDYTLAVDALELAFTLANEDIRQQARARSDLAAVYLLKGDMKKMLDTYKEAAALYRQRIVNEYDLQQKATMQAELDRIDNVIKSNDRR